MTFGADTGSHQVLRSQKNELFHDIARTGLEPADFVWGSRVSWLNRSAPTLIHVPTSSYYMFEFVNGDHQCEYSPGRDRPVVRVNLVVWVNVMTHFDEWLEYVEREYNAPDLWAELAKERKLLGATGPDASPREDTPFTPDEQRVVAAQLREIRELIVATTSLDAAQVGDLDARLGYVQQAMTRLPRRDWFGIFFTTVVSFVLAHHLDSALIGEIMRFATNGFGHLFGGGLPELPGTPIPTS